jgi:hypothetical protein
MSPNVAPSVRPRTWLLTACRMSDHSARSEMSTMWVGQHQLSRSRSAFTFRVRGAASSLESSRGVSRRDLRCLVHDGGCVLRMLGHGTTARSRMTLVLGCHAAYKGTDARSQPLDTDQHGTDRMLGGPAVLTRWFRRESPLMSPPREEWPDGSGPDADGSGWAKGFANSYNERGLERSGAFLRRLRTTPSAGVRVGAS